MAKKTPGLTPTVQLQPAPTFNPNPPAATVAGALENNQAQVDKAKAK
jgi:hypothetical protein